MWILINFKRLWKIERRGERVREDGLQRQKIPNISNFLNKIMYQEHIFSLIMNILNQRFIKILKILQENLNMSLLFESRLEV